MADRGIDVQDDDRTRTAVARAGGLTRFIVLVPVAGLLAAAVALVAIGAIDTAKVIGQALGIAGEKLSTKEAVVEFIELADVFLLGIVLYIISLGLFELFVGSTLRLPSWLTFNDLNDLKERLLGVIVVVLAVLFLGKVIEVRDYLELLMMGGAIAPVIASVSYFLKNGH